MFERFTDRARRVVVLAHEHAQLLGHREIDVAHVLLGIISEGESLGFRALSAFDITEKAVSEAVGTRRPSEGQVAGHVPFTKDAKRVFELALREALQLGHNYIGVEHILLGICRQGNGVAIDVLIEQGVDLAALRREVIRLLVDTQPRPVGRVRAYTPVSYVCGDCGVVLADKRAHDEWHRLQEEPRHG